MEVATTEPTGEGLAAPATEAQQPVVQAQEQEEQPVELTDAEQPAEETTAETEGDETPETETEGADAEPQEPETVEIEFDGETFNIPAKLKAGFMMNADYTRKTQEVAEIRKEAEATREEAAKVFQSSKEFIEAKAVMMNIDNQLKQYENVDWTQLEQEDPVGAMSHWRQYQQLQAGRNEVGQYLNKAETERSAAAEQETANRMRQTVEFAQKEIPGWNQQVDQEIEKFATGFGFTAEQLRSAMSPQIYKVLHRAMLGEKLLQQQKTAQKPVIPPAKPLNKVSAKASTVVNKNPEDMSMEEYVAYRKAEGARLR